MHLPSVQKFRVLERILAFFRLDLSLVQPSLLEKAWFPPPMKNLNGALILWKTLLNSGSRHSFDFHDLWQDIMRAQLL